MTEARLTHPCDLAGAAEALRSGERAPGALIDELCDRIDSIDGRLHAILPEPERRARLHREADALEDRFSDPEERPLLYGVPVGVKDIFCVDGFETRCGSELPPELFEGPEGACVARLRAAGALILGKTVTTEFAYFEPGPTANPHNLGHTPGGSSSGSAAAVAAGLCPLAIGSQTVGSVIRPAAFCGVVGFKPTFGRIPIEGVLPFSPSVDHVGVFAQSAAGAALAASVLCDGWAPVEDVDRPVLGVPDGTYLSLASDEALRLFEAQLGALKRAGYTVRSVPALEDVAALDDRHQRLIASEMAVTHAAWFAEYEMLYRPRTAGLIRRGLRNLKENLEFYLELPLSVADPHFDAAAGEIRAIWTAFETIAQFPEDQALRHEIAVMIDSARDLLFSLSGPRPVRSMLRLRTDLEALMAEHAIDVWVCPAATSPAPEGLHSTGDPAMNLPWTHAGMPALTLPAGRSANGLPVGLQCVARAGHDERLLAWGVRLEGTLASPRS